MPQTKEERYERRKKNAIANKGMYLAKILPELQRLSIELHGGKYAPAQAEYYLHGRDTIDKTTIAFAFGTWPEVVALSGLTMASYKYYCAKRGETRNEWKRLKRSPKLLTADREADIFPPLGLIVKDKPKSIRYRSGGEWVDGWAWEVLW